MRAHGAPLAVDHVFVIYITSEDHLQAIMIISMLLASNLLAGNMMGRQMIDMFLQTRLHGAPSVFKDHEPGHNPPARARTRDNAHKARSLILIVHIMFIMRSRLPWSQPDDLARRP